MPKDKNFWDWINENYNSRKEGKEIHYHNPVLKAKMQSLLNHYGIETTLSESYVKHETDNRNLRSRYYPEPMLLSQSEFSFMFPKQKFIEDMNKKFQEKYINSQEHLKLEHEAREEKVKRIFFSSNW